MTRFREEKDLKNILIMSLLKLSFRTLIGAAANNECNSHIFISINSSVIGLQDVKKWCKNIPNLGCTVLCQHVWACAVVLSQNLQCQLGFRGSNFSMNILLAKSFWHYINLVVSLMLLCTASHILDQFNNQSRADIDCLRSLQNPPNHTWMINLRSYVKEIPAFFLYHR